MSRLVRRGSPRGRGSVLRPVLLTLTRQTRKFLIQRTMLLLPLTVAPVDASTDTTISTSATTGSATPRSNNNNTVVVVVEVDVIVPVHNASKTLRETVASAMSQVWLCGGGGLSSSSLSSSSSSLPVLPQSSLDVSIHVCCYNDASSDDSWSILQELSQQYAKPSTTIPNQPNESSFSSPPPPPQPTTRISSRLHIASSPPGSLPRGAGYARNRAVAMRSDQNATATTTTTDAAAATTSTDDSVAKSTSATTTTEPSCHHFICWLDSDDIMHPTRVYHQVSHFLAMPPETSCCRRRRRCTIVGTHFDRSPVDATPHYTTWANQLTPLRLGLERFREITILQPTWMMYRERLVDDLGGYLEAPSPLPLPALNKDDNDKSSSFSPTEWAQSQEQPPNSSSTSSTNDALSSRNINESTTTLTPPQRRWRLVHPTLDTPVTLRVAEDLRLFHEHLAMGGYLERVTVSPPPPLLRTDANGAEPEAAPAALPATPLVTYRHSTSSQSGETSRKLLVALRVAALEHAVLSSSPCGTNHTNGCAAPAVPSAVSWAKFVLWGAGRDGKDFVKALSPSVQRQLYCIVDVDDQKIQRGFYEVPTNRSENRRDGVKVVAAAKHRIPIVHFSLLTRDSTVRDHLYRNWKEGRSHGETVELESAFGRIDKSFDLDQNDFIPSIESSQNQNNQPVCTISPSTPPASKRAKTARSSITEKQDPGVKSLDIDLLPSLPVIVCVAMYRTNGALERNVQMIDRTEGLDLWHFS